MGNSVIERPSAPEVPKFECSASVTIASGCTDWRGFSFSDPIGVVRLLWTRSHSALIHPLPMNLIREIAVFLLLPEAFLARMSESGLQWLNVRTNRWSEPTRLNHTVHFFDFSTFLALDSQRVFVNEAGAYKHDRDNYLLTRSAYLITTTCAPGSVYCDVKQLPDTIFGHRGAGLIHDGDAVYLFGGQRGTYTSLSSMSFTLHFKMQKKAEYLSLACKAWTPLADMSQERGLFTPCVYCRQVYLFAVLPPGVPDRGWLEVFNLDTHEYRTFTAIAIPPNQFSLWDFVGTATFIANEKLVIITNKQTVIVELERESGPLKGLPDVGKANKVFDHSSLDIRPSSQIVKYGNSAYWMQKGECMRLSIGEVWETSKL